MILLAIYLTLENIRWLFNGILTSAGDTFFLMIVGASSVWLFMLLPTYFLMVRLKGGIETAFYIWIFYSCAACTLLAYRFFQGKWKKKHLIETRPLPPCVDDRQPLSPMEL